MIRIIALAITVVKIKGSPGGGIILTTKTNVCATSRHTKDKYNKWQCAVTAKIIEGHNGSSLNIAPALTSKFLLR